MEKIFSYYRELSFIGTEDLLCRPESLSRDIGSGHIEDIPLVVVPGGGGGHHAGADAVDSDPVTGPLH